MDGLSVPNSYFPAHSAMPNHYSENENPSTDDVAKSFVLDVGQPNDTSCALVHHNISPLSKKSRLSQQNGLRA